MKLTCELACELLAYDPETGLLTWRPRSPSHFPSDKHSAEHNAKIWNQRYAGRRAGYTTPKGYDRLSIFETAHYSHRVIFLMMTGRWPSDEIDHKDGVRSNNKWDNLREATTAQNKQNTGVFVTNTSGFTGVSRAKANKWQAQISADGEVHHLGTFETPEEAAAAYRSAKYKLHSFQPISRC